MRWIDQHRASCIGDGSCSSISSTLAWICTRTPSRRRFPSGQARRGAQASQGPKQPAAASKPCVSLRAAGGFLPLPTRQVRSRVQPLLNSYEARLKPWFDAKPRPRASPIIPSLVRNVSPKINSMPSAAALRSISWSNAEPTQHAASRLQSTWKTRRRVPRTRAPSGSRPRAFHDPLPSRLGAA